jgi:hypothetical protein
MFIVPQGQDCLPRRVLYGIVLQSTIRCRTINYGRASHPDLTLVKSLPGLTFYAVPCACTGSDRECVLCSGSGRVVTRRAA